MYIVPMIIGLKIINTTLHDEFVAGKDAQPLIDVFDSEEFGDWFLEGLLNEGESFEDGQKKVTRKQKIMNLYNAIFTRNHSIVGGEEQNLGHFRFGANSREFAISAASMLSDYADFNA